jgi:WS/DGAT/MGAT family acyltransferase
VRNTTGVAGELAYLLTMPSDTQTRLKGTPLGDKRVAWTDPIGLPEVKAVSHALGCSVNDMLLAAATGAIRGYLEEKGDHTAGVEIRVLVPINLRPPDSGEELGNRFGIIAVELPVGLESPLERLYEIRRRIEALKTSYEPAVTLGLFAGLGYAPKVVQDMLFDLLVSRATAVMTNVPGPQRALYLAGSALKQVMFWVPQTGSIGMGVSLLSFNGQVHFGLITDAALVPDPDAIIARFGPEFERLVYVALMG